MKVERILLIDTFHIQASELDKLRGKDVSEVFHFAQPRPMPLGLLYVGSYIQEQFPETDVQILDLNNLCNMAVEENYFKDNSLNTFLEAHLDAYIEEFRPQLVGVQYLFNASHKYVVEVCRRIKKKHPEIKIMVGGNAASVTTETIRDNDDIDFIVRGEGELPTTSIMRHLQGEDVELKGVYTKDRRILDVDTIDDLDSIPFPKYDQLLLGKEWYFTEEGWGRRTYPDEWVEDIEYRTAVFLHSRGCPYECIFCASHLVHGRKVRERSLENVRQELTLMKEKYGINRILASDDTFNLRKERTLALLDIIADQGMELVLPNNISMRVLDEDLLRGFQKTRTKSLHVAIESGNQLIQDKVMKKKLDLEDIRRKAALLREFGFWVRAYWVLGLPGETPETVMDTIQYAGSLPLDWNVFHMATPLIGTEMYEIAKRDGLLKYENLADIHYQNNVMDVLEEHGESIRDAYEFANITRNFTQNYNMVHGETRRAIGAFLDVLRCYPHHAVGWHCLAQCYESLGMDQELEEARASLQNALKNPEGKRLYDKYVLSLGDKGYWQ